MLWMRKKESNEDLKSHLVHFVLLSINTSEKPAINWTVKKRQQNHLIVLQVKDVTTFILFAHRWMTMMMEHIIYINTIRQPRFSSKFTWRMEETDTEMNLEIDAICWNPNMNNTQYVTKLTNEHH